MKLSIALLLITLSLLNIYCSDDNLVKPENNNPIILSLVVFPEIVNPNDSLIVICNAFDSDGDTLVYDWYTTGVIRIKGLPSWDCCALYNSYENSQIFYAPDSAHVSAPQDTFWVQCAIRDRVGGQDVRLVNFIVRQDSEGD